ncbi:DUF5348 domain-containing protein [Solibacillus isronensis]|uniref:DUF5348 domain-containing protein n=1 Tax=Solibacillus isronensis TaxID=412383 RepID=UPI0007FB42C7|nr:DUF5348 domain-containing protein [Solibacillus silvestris]OBW54765.1 hypothetical protein A9986_14175 [Solibacillus silvestris]
MSYNDVMLKPSEALEDLKKLQYKMDMFIKRVGDTELENVESENNIEEALIRSQLATMVDKLDDVVRALKYLELEVVETGTLELNESDRLALPSGFYYTSGNTIEIKYFDTGWNKDEWLITSIEHTDGHYYATALGRDIRIEGYTARRREPKY